MSVYRWVVRIHPSSRSVCWMRFGFRGNKSQEGLILWALGDVCLLETDFPIPPLRDYRGLENDHYTCFSG